MICLNYLVLLPLFLFCDLSIAFYLSGNGNAYFPNDIIPIYASKLSSVKTGLPLDYYSLPHCMPQKIKYLPLSLGEILTGDRKVNTLYDVQLFQSRINVLCNISGNSVNKFKKVIDLEYRVNLVLDDLPIISRFGSKQGDKNFFEFGYPIGTFINGKYFVNSYITLIVKYNIVNNATYIVGFDYEFANEATELNSVYTNIVFKYQIKFIEVATPWYLRWNYYLDIGNNQIHWIALLNTVIVVLFLSFIVATILMRTLKRDFAIYSKDDNLDLMEEELEESGWKLLHGDVFRAPSYPLLFSVFVGNGFQIIFMIFCVLGFALLGTLSPANPGSVFNMAIFGYLLLSILNGFVASKLYKTFRGQHFKTLGLWTALVLPSIVLSVCFIVNLLVWYKGSTLAVPFTSMIVIISLWFGVQLPFTFLGIFFGAKSAAIEYPVRTHQIPRAILPQPWFLSLFSNTMLAGILPFGVIFIEFFFIFNATWEGHYYFFYGFLFALFVLSVIVVSLCSVISTYFNLSTENHRWWWKSIVTSFGCSSFLFLFTVYYYLFKSKLVGFTPMIVFFTYSSILCGLFALFSGTIGFCASFVFVKTIYGSIKIE